MLACAPSFHHGLPGGQRKPIMTTISTPADVAAPYGLQTSQPVPSVRKSISLPYLADMHARHEPIVMLTAYDATFAAMADAAGVECLLVGDSLGMVCQGLPSTVGISSS